MAGMFDKQESKSFQNKTGSNKKEAQTTTQRITVVKTRWRPDTQIILNLNLWENSVTANMAEV